MWYGSLVTLAVLAAGPIYLYHRRVSSYDRKRVLPTCEERIVILGASSVNGIGAAIAAQCLVRGAHNIMLVGRRSDALREVKMALIAQQDTPEQRERAEQLQLFVADCTDEEDVLRIADSVNQNFGGIDTVYIVFGIMCGQPLLALADMDPMAGATRTQPTLESLRSVSEVAQQCSNANMTGTALVLAALIPCLQTTSNSPYVALIGSLAALIPAPTRSLYCATKAAQQMLVQSIASECRAQAEKKGRALVQFYLLPSLHDL
ncbi:hypothetical protein MYAM1_001163 [Malassezia yamatoensis]|uniref:Uncharacterized protein n=1 Tax=Malassezia yamatoensis TaxID=253288 RepID=A0AAJ5YTD8_9BASI|nr:hypothetical protein MYAM1_001163 [Malassezia yamatoensis]